MTIWNSAYPDPDNFGGGYSKEVQSVDTIVANVRQFLEDYKRDCERDIDRKNQKFYADYQFKKIRNATLEKENERLKKALKEIIDECQQERVYATEIQEKSFIDEVEQRAKLALTIEESKR